MSKRRIVALFLMSLLCPNVAFAAASAPIFDCTADAAIEPSIRQTYRIQPLQSSGELTACWSLI